MDGAGCRDLVTPGQLARQLADRRADEQTRLQVRLDRALKQIGTISTAGPSGKRSAVLLTNRVRPLPVGPRTTHHHHAPQSSINRHADNNETSPRNPSMAPDLRLRHLRSRRISPHPAISMALGKSHQPSVHRVLHQDRDITCYVPTLLPRPGADPDPPWSVGRLRVVSAPLVLSDTCLCSGCRDGHVACRHPSDHRETPLATDRRDPTHHRSFSRRDGFTTSPAALLTAVKGGIPP